MARILVVDDQQDIRELVRMTMEMGGHEVHEAEDGSQALELARKLSPDLMLLDVMMPGDLDGLAVCRALRSASGGRRPSIVMLSAKGQRADQQAGIAAGADAYLTKPFSPRQLLQTVERMV